MTGSLVPDWFPQAAGTTQSRLVPRFPSPKGNREPVGGVPGPVPSPPVPSEREPVEGNQSLPPRHIRDCLAELIATLEANR